MRKLEYIITTEYDNFTVETFFRRVHGFSKRMITRIKSNRQSISCNQKHIRMIDPLHIGDHLVITFMEEGYIAPNSQLFAKIEYEDEDVIVFNKPFDMPTHPSKNHRTDTLANVFANYCEINHLSIKFRPINRLDRDTSGLCVVAKNPVTAAKLKIEKEYFAILTGCLPLENGTIDLPIARISEVGIMRHVHDRGKRCITHFKVVGRTSDTTTVSVTLETGRTHQIRVHFSHIGYPLIGDIMYGGDCTKINRQALHCLLVAFMHPITGEHILIKSNVPEDFPISLKNNHNTN